MAGFSWWMMGCRWIGGGVWLVDDGLLVARFGCE